MIFLLIRQISSLYLDWREIFTYPLRHILKCFVTSGLVKYSGPSGTYADLRTKHWIEVMVPLMLR